MTRFLDIKTANKEIIDFLISKGFLEKDTSYKNLSKIKITINPSRPVKVKLEYSTAGIFFKENTKSDDKI